MLAGHVLDLVKALPQVQFGNQCVDSHNQLHERPWGPDALETAEHEVQWLASLIENSRIEALRGLPPCPHFRHNDFAN